MTFLSLDRQNLFITIPILGVSSLFIEMFAKFKNLSFDIQSLLCAFISSSRLMALSDSAFDAVFLDKREIKSPNGSFRQLSVYFLKIRKTKIFTRVPKVKLVKMVLFE